MTENDKALFAAAMQGVMPIKREPRVTYHKRSEYQRKPDAAKARRKVDGYNAAFWSYKG